MELIPRITRPQAMDALLQPGEPRRLQGGDHGRGASPKIFPMMMTAAGTLQAAQVS